MHQSALRLSVLLLSCLLVACGGGDSISPPPPSSGGGAVTLAVSAGDGQLAAPGAAVASAPVVTARNASGPVAGLAITFAIDSGGGTLASTQATTGADGTASPGAWTLGALEGTNVLSVSASGATTIRIRATATIPTIPLVTDASVPRSGGVVTVAVPGNPFNGLTLTVPDTAFATPAVISIATKNMRVLTLPAGYAQVGPALVITNSQGTATRPMVMTIPITVQSPDTALATFFVDPATGTMELLPITARTTTTLTVFSRHFSSDKMLKLASARIVPRVPGGPSGTPAARAAGFSPAVIIVVSVPTATLNATTTTGFAPGRDDWEFSNNGSILEPEGICAGMSISALYYFYALRGSGTLSGRFNPFTRSVFHSYTNNGGIRLASVIQADADQSILRQWSNTVAALSLVTGVPKPTLFYQALVMAMQVTHMPQFLAIYGTGFGHAVVAYGSANGTVSFSDPNDPGLGRSMTFANNAFAPFPFLSRGGAPADVVNRVETIGASSMIDAQAVAADWAQVSDSTIGQTRFPKAYLQTFDAFTRRFVTIDTTKPVIFTSRKDFFLQTKCPASSCAFFYLPDTLINTWLINESGELISDADGGFASVVLNRGAQRFGVVEFAASNLNGGRAWSRFRQITVNYQPVELAPKVPQIKPDSTIAFIVTSGELASQIAKYVWEFNDGQASVTTTTAAITHTYSTIGAYKARVTMSDAADRIIARDSTTVTVASADKAYSVWQLDTLVITTGGTVSTPPSNNVPGQRAVNEYNRQLAYWQARAALAASARPTLWFLGTAATINNAVGGYTAGLYLSDSLPGSNAGRDPTLAATSIAPAAVPGGAADDPLLSASWLVTGTPPNGGMLTATSAPPSQYECIGVFRSAYYSAAITFAMNVSRGNGTITYTYRDLTPSCSRPNAESARWTLTVSFKAKRVL